MNTQAPARRPIRTEQRPNQHERAAPTTVSSDWKDSSKPQRSPQDSPWLTVLIFFVDLKSKNICLIFGDAKKFLAKIDAPFFDFIFILFPDPWPKKRHWKRRLIDKEFLSLLKKRLKNKGRLIVKTDWQDYAKNLANELVNFPTCNNEDSLGFLRPIKTKYERKGEEEGRTIFTYISDLNE